MKKILCAVMILGLLITGCASAKNDSAEDYVVKINDEAVSKEEFNIYLFETQKSFEQFGGADIWDTDFDGKSAEDVAKDNTLTTVNKVKTSKQKAADMGITLTDEESEEAKTEAADMYGELTDDQKSKIGADEQLYQNVLMDNYLYSKVYEETVKDYTVDENSFEDYYNTYKDELAEQYKTYVNSEETVDDDTLKDYSRYLYDMYMKQQYFTAECEKWESAAKIEKNNAVWNEITLIK